MNNYLPLAAPALLTILSACATTTSPEPASSSTPTAAVPPVTTAAPAAQPPVADEPSCKAGQFVSCHSGDDCTRRRTTFLKPKTCYSRAAAACTAAACEHGCDIYNTEIGGPKMVLCAPNASSTGHMKVCGGIANWACPEGMTCKMPPATVRDGSGECVPLPM